MAFNYIFLISSSSLSNYSSCPLRLFSMRSRPFFLIFFLSRSNSASLAAYICLRRKCQRINCLIPSLTDVNIMIDMFMTIWIANIRQNPYPTVTDALSSSTRGEKHITK
jgi:hypothetical protein